MPAEIRYEPVAYCADCVEGREWNDEPEEWAEKHNTEHHEGATE